MLVLACRTPQPVADKPPVTALPLSYEVLEQGNYCGVEESGQELIQDASRWAQLWKQLSAQRFPVPPVPEVNFAEESVVACFMGQQMTGGYAIQVKSLNEEGEQVYVDLIYERPAPDCMVTEALTQPYLLLRLPVAGLKGASFSVTKEQRGC